MNQLVCVPKVRKWSGLGFILTFIGQKKPGLEIMIIPFADICLKPASMLFLQWVW